MTAAPSQRQLRVAELVRHTIAEILARGDTHDPDLDGLVITVPEVRMSPDLKVATVLVMPLGGANLDKAVAALERARGRLKGLVGRRVQLKFVPELRFVLDTRYEDDMRVDALLKDALPGDPADEAPRSEDGDDER